MMPAPATFRGNQHNARTLALHVLGLCRRHDAFLQEILDQQLTQHPLSAADRRLTTQLTYGVLRRRGTLHALLQPLVARPAVKVEAWLWDALYLGACQLALMSQIPVHAAIHETVELAAQFGRPGAKGFLNGVLRALSALVTPERTTAPGPDALPLEKGEYRRLARPVLPDLAVDPVEYLAAGFGLPDWIARRWLTRYDAEECRRLGFWFAGPAPLTLRCNPLRTDRETLLQALRGSGVNAETGLHPQAIRVQDHVPIRELPGYEEGWFAVQDEASMRVASALAPAAGMTVLDLCAAPGGKTTHLAELMADRGRIVAADVDAKRLETVAGLAMRLGITIIEPRRLTPDGGLGEPAEMFDAALVDVPCSNTGVLGRRPEVRWRLRPSDLKRLVALQVRLLRLGARHVKPGGVVVYSTCSIEPEENQEVVRQVADVLHLEVEEEQVPGDRVMAATGPECVKRLEGKAMSDTTKTPTPDPLHENAAAEHIREQFPTIAIDMPVMFEDEGQEEMGETDIHTKTTAILFYGLTAHCATRRELQVFSDLNCYYHPIQRWAYCSPDVMVVAPRLPLVEPVTSYRISGACPAPQLVVEVLSRRSFQQQDLTNKPEIYADLGVPEYILADPTGQFLPQKLLLKRLRPDSVWKDEQDADGGVTSRLGFRVVIEGDEQLRLIHAQTGSRYARPEEAQAEAERALSLEMELAKLRAKLPKESKGKGKRRKP